MKVSCHIVLLLIIHMRIINQKRKGNELCVRKREDNEYTEMKIEKKIVREGRGNNDEI